MIEEHRAKKRLCATRIASKPAERLDGVGNYPGREIDPIEFARAYAPMRADAEMLLSVADQKRIQATLKGYLAGIVEHENWLEALRILSRARRRS